MRRAPILLLVAGALAACGGGSNARTVPPPSSDPHTASLAYARCLRAHGVPHPDPDRRGDFKLTPADERRLRSVGPQQRKAAEDACFHYLKGLNLRPLSRQALARADAVLEDLRRCIHGHGYEVGEPEVRNLSRGRAFFGFKRVPGDAPPPGSAGHARYLRDLHACEKRVGLARRISKIIDEDRAAPKPGDL
jgi:hypothetical protein